MTTVTDRQKEIFKHEAPPFYERSLESQFKSEMFSSQIGKMFYGVMKGSRVSCSCWIELHYSVALLL